MHQEEPESTKLRTIGSHAACGEVSMFFTTAFSLDMKLALNRMDLRKDSCQGSQWLDVNIR